MTLTSGEDEDAVALAAADATHSTTLSQPLHQLITAFSRATATSDSETLSNDFLYYSFANIMSQVSCVPPHCFLFQYYPIDMIGINI